MPQSATESQLPTHTPKYKRLTDDARVAALRLANLGKTQNEIAETLNCDQSTISRWLNACGDTTAEAKAYFRGQALPMALKIRAKGRPADLIAVQKGLGVLEEQQGNGLTIVIGGSNHDVKVAVLSSPSPQVQIGPGESPQNP